MNNGMARRQLLQLAVGAAAIPCLTRTAASAEGRITEYLGRGIDIFRSDPWGPSLKEQVFSKAPVFEKIPLDQTGMEETYADSLLDISRKIAVEAGVSGSYGGFSGSVSSKFSQSEQSTEKRHFMKITVVVSGDRIFIRGGKDALKATLNDDFKRALANSTATDLFAKFGTHVATKMRIGGKAEYFCQSLASSQMSQRDFELAAVAKYKSLGGSIEGSTKYSESNKSSSNEVVGSSSIATVGGTPRSAAGIGPNGGWAAWAQSAAAVPGFLGFDELVPIWEFAEGQRRDIIRTAYRQRAAKAMRSQIISVTSKAASHPDASVALPQEYKLISGGARDNYKGEGNLLTGSFPEVTLPNTSTNTWRGNGKDHRKSDPASVSSYALAIYDPDDIWDVYIQQATSASTNWPSGEASLPNGYVLVGGGARVNYGSGEGNMLVGSYPKDQRTWVAKSKDHLVGDKATITVFAIGLKCKVPGIKLVQSITTSASNIHQHPDAERGPDSGVMVGGGALATFGDQGILLTGSYPKDGQTWAASAKDHLAKDEGSVTAYCIGLQVVDAA